MTSLNHISLIVVHVHKMHKASNLRVARKAKLNRKNKNATRTHKANVARCGETNDHTINHARACKMVKNDLHQQNVYTRLSTRSERNNNKIRNENQLLKSRIVNRESNSLQNIINQINQCIDTYSGHDQISNSIL